jgi:hypothetical protein
LISDPQLESGIAVTKSGSDVAAIAASSYRLDVVAAIHADEQHPLSRMVSFT